jgi:glycerol uptake facilitator-like aquaporin
MLARHLVAEALGTAILVATVVGSGIMAERLAGGNEAIALLGNTLPTGAILVVLVSIFTPVSGAHFNPAVTLVFAARAEFPKREVLPYIAAQCAGGILGTVIAHLMFDLAPLDAPADQICTTLSQNTNALKYLMLPGFGHRIRQQKSW